jgi:clan AA aspartic protease (TIGR02281 family)
VKDSAERPPKAGELGRSARLNDRADGAAFGEPSVQRGLRSGQPVSLVTWILFFLVVLLSADRLYEHGVRGRKGPGIESPEAGGSGRPDRSEVPAAGVPVSRETALTPDELALLAIEPPSGKPEIPPQASLPARAPVAPRITPIGTPMVVLTRGRGGDFHAPGAINGQSVDFMVDPAGPHVRVPERLAQRLGLVRGMQTLTWQDDALAVYFETEIHHLTLGPILLQNIKAMLDPAAGGDSVILGKSALDLIGTAQDEDRLILGRPPAPAAFADADRSGSAPVKAVPELRDTPLVLRKSVRECMGSGNRIDDEVIRCMQGN